VGAALPTRHPPAWSPLSRPVEAAALFGLAVTASEPIAALCGPVAASAPSLYVEVARDHCAAEVWPSDAEVVCDERSSDGRSEITVSHHPDHGFMIAGNEYGSHLLVAGATRLVCFPEGAPEARWQRMLIAQALPFAAVVRGHEALHAGAVVHSGRALGLVGPSGSGKTSLAVELCGRGAEFLADDVLVLERRARSLVAHAGPAAANVIPAGSEQPRHDNEKRPVRMAVGPPSAELTALFLLDRSPEGPRLPAVASAADARSLLSCTFNLILGGAGRLERLLDVCAYAATSMPVERVSFGPDTNVEALADTIEERMNAGR
jgi:hypothetical protein